MASNKNLGTWTHVPPIAILAKLAAKQKVADEEIMNTLDCLGYVENGKIDTESADRQFDLYNKNKQVDDE